MPSGNQEPRRNPELKRKARLAVFLVLHFSGWLSHCLFGNCGDNYGRSGATESSPLCQHSDNEPEAKRECSVVIPDDWQLTSQQQAFIELFAEDDQPKQ